MKKMILAKFALMAVLLSSCATEEIVTATENQKVKLLKSQEMIDFEKSLVEYGKTVSENPATKEEAGKIFKTSISAYLNIDKQENKTEGQLLIEALNQHSEKLKELNSNK